MNIKKYLVYSTIFSLFTEAFYIKVGIDLKLFYIIIIINSIILYRLSSFRVNKGFVFLMSALTVTSIINIAIEDNNVPKFLMQFVGVTICASYYYNFIIYVNNKEALFLLYARFSYKIAQIGIPLYFIQPYLYNSYDTRLKSILNEPAHFCAIILPAFFMFFWKFIKEKKHKKEVVVMLIAIMLSSSSIGYVGVLLVILLGSKLDLIKFLFTGLFVMLLAFGFYKSNEKVKIRVDDSLAVFNTFNVHGANLSTYALASNLFVTYKNFINNPVIGTGVGSYEFAHSKYLMSLDGIGYMKTNNGGKFISLNKDDANSLFLRFTAENGAMGVFIIFFFLIANRKGLNKQSRMISNAVLVYILLKLLREGHYFPPEMWFFFTLYYYRPITEKNKN